MADDVKTYRGRSLEELLPQVREELGPDAVVLRRREGLAGGVGGFFQRRFVEIDARGPLTEEGSGMPRNDRATAEGLSSPAVRTLVEQAQPFAEALARAESGVAARAQDVLAAAARGALGGEPDAAPDLLGAFRAPGATSRLSPEPDEPHAPVEAGLYGPQRRLAEPPVEEPDRFVALEADAAFAGPETAGFADAPPPAPSPPAPAPPPPAPAPAPAPPPPAVALPELPAFVASPLPPPRPVEADALERALVAAGFSATLAADVVGEALAHDLPFDRDAGLTVVVRRALARRLPVAPIGGAGARILAVAGAGGAGKTTTCEHLAAAYARAGQSVVVVALRAPDGGSALAARVQSLGVTVFSAAAVDEVAPRLAVLRPQLVLVDCPAVRPGDRDAVEALAADLRALGAGQVHLALPATLSAAAAEEAVAALAPLGVTHVALTHADETARPGAPVERAIRARRPLAFETTSAATTPLHPLALAERLLP
jgi:flagellar biosynthesis GTPase FlhF